jgi:MFS family permease
VTSVLAAGIAWRALGTVAWAAQRNSIVRHGDASRKPLIFANAVAVVGGGLFNVVLPSYATVTLGLTVTESGLVFALFGSGAVLVTLLGSLIARRLDTRVAVLVAFVLSAVSAASLAIPLLPFVGLVVMGAGSALRATSVVGFIQERTPDEHLPATIGALQASTSTGLAIGSLGGTAVAGVVSPHASIIVMAAVTVCALAFYLSSSARARSAE